MIGRIAGILLEKVASQVLVDVNGVGYEIDVPLSTLGQLPEPGKAVVLNTHFVVREDAQLLYGFIELRERSLFRILIKINGVGPKMGLAILSGMAVTELVHAVQNNDLKALVRLPGVGKKTAERLVIELRDKLNEWELDDSVSLSATRSSQSSTIHEAEAALVSLGYKSQEADKAIRLAVTLLEEAGKPLASAALIRLALKNKA